MLLDSGAEVNANLGNGVSALSMTSNCNIAQLLIEHGADVTKGSARTTLITLASNDEFRLYLKKKGLTDSLGIYET